MSEPDFFPQNLARWSKFNQKTAQDILETNSEKVARCLSKNGEPNLSIDVKGKAVHLHDLENPSKEAGEIVSALDLYNTQVLYVYGLGLGYLYNALKEWLKGSSQHSLVFFEEDPAVIHRFLQTEKAADLLHNPQVWLVYMDDTYESLDNTLDLFPTQPFQVVASRYMRDLYPLKVQEFKSKVDFLSNLKSVYITEFQGYGIGFLSNYYRNLFYLPQAYLGIEFTSAFVGVPAIVCGAGPSLDKNIQLLKTLQDKALIFAGGTALNAINAEGIQPHFGVGIDPNREQFTRIIMNTAFEVPFFYRNRIFHTALSLVHSDRLFFSGSSGYDISDYFDKALGIPNADFEEGCNVIHFSASIAALLGCNPIIFVGVDLAYTDKKSYASGIIPHPIHIRKDNFRTKEQNEELVVKKDVNGQDVFTLWKWITESLWYTNMFNRNPGTKLVNATEGGLGFPRIPNMTLADAAEKFLTKEYDFNARIHAETQNARPNSNVTYENIAAAMKKFGESLERAHKLCGDIAGELAYLTQRNKEDKTIPEDLQNKELKNFLQQFELEESYVYLIKNFDSAFERMAKKEKLRFIIDHEQTPPKDLIERKLNLEKKRYLYLRDACKINADHINAILNEQEAKHKRMQSQAKANSKKIVLPKDPLEGVEYSYKDNVLKINDPEFNLNIEEKFTPDVLTGFLRLHHPNGALKLENLYKDGKLHGPSSYYTPDGILLARSWYFNGLRVGKTVCYYSTGKLKSVLRSQEGVWDGPQLHYFEDGSKRAIINFNKGQLHGDILLYHYTGRMARELHFVQGKRNGIERIWSDDGLLIIEASFKDDQPIGTARLWYPNGNVSQEYVYDEQGQLLSVRRWEENGYPLPSEKVRNEDYFDKVAKRTDDLTNSLSEVVEQLKNVAPLMLSNSKEQNSSSGLSQSFEEDLAAIHKELAHLQEIGKEMNFETGMSPESGMEAIWKSPSARREVERQLETMTQEMTEGITNMQKTFRQSLEDLAKKLKDDKK